MNDNLKFNQETEFVPILGLIQGQLNARKSDTDDDKSSESVTPPKVASSVQENHHSVLLQLLAGELSVAPEEIHDFELSVPHLQDFRILTHKQVVV